MNWTYHDEDACALALNTIFGFQPQISLSLIRGLGSASAAFSLSREELRNILGPYSSHADKICQQAFDSASTELESLRADGYSFIHIGMDCYPKLLRECEDAPIGLYIRSGTAPDALFDEAPFIGIVGTRDISPYGTECCERIVRALSEAPAKPVIVSGLALGVDICAHRAALRLGIRTIGISPVGVRDVYPFRHRNDAAAMAESPGSGIVTDYPPGTAPVAINFLRRNRIIAGLSQAMILVESKVRGGGMMTARLASGYGRDVFCVPGRLDDVRSGGCNLLIAEKLSECISSFDALPEALGLGRWKRTMKAGLMDEVRARYGGRKDLDSIAAVVAEIRRDRGISTDEICERLSRQYNEIAPIVGMLENDGFVVTDLMQRCSIDARNH